MFFRRLQFLQFGFVAIGSLTLLVASCSGAQPTATDVQQQQSTSEGQTPTEPSPQSTLDGALSTAYSTSVLTQTAQTIADWEQVRQGWQSAIDQLSSIPEPTEQYEQAQQKIQEYQSNLKYAEQELIKAREFSDPVSMTVTVEQTSDARARIHGETNLPDGSEILVSMSNNLGNEFQDDPIVSNGKFTTVLGPDNGLATAKYTIEALFSPFAQSDAIQEIVGSKGEKLKGSLVSEATVIEGMKIASMSPVEFNVGDPVAIAKADSDNKQLAREVYNSAQNLLEQAKAMQSLRESSDLQKQSQCIKRMRELQTQVKNLDQKSQALSQQYVWLKASITALEIGVTCDADLAPDFIAEAESNLRQASEVIQ